MGWGVIQKRGGCAKLLPQPPSHTRVFEVKRHSIPPDEFLLVAYFCMLPHTSGVDEVEKLVPGLVLQARLLEVQVPGKKYVWVRERWFWS